MFSSDGKAKYDPRALRSRGILAKNRNAGKKLRRQENKRIRTFWIFDCGFRIEKAVPVHGSQFTVHCFSDFLDAFRACSLRAGSTLKIRVEDER